MTHQDDERTAPLTRRTFVLHSCEAASLAAPATILQGCGDSQTSPSTTVPSLSTINGTVANGAVSVSVDAGSPLAPVNSAALVQSSSGSFLVARHYIALHGLRTADLLAGRVPGAIRLSSSVLRG